MEEQRIPDIGVLSDWARRGFRVGGGFVAVLLRPQLRHAVRGRMALAAVAAVAAVSCS